jgi:hypothetical protein
MSLNSTIWHPMVVRPMPLLATLRDAVLMRSTKRMPIWRFRIADDVVVRIQPRPARYMKGPLPSPFFECAAVIHEGADAAMLKDPPRDSWHVRFRIAQQLDEWYFRLTGIGHGGGITTDPCMAIRKRLRTILPPAFDKLRPSLMLKPACLLCGKLLTDPVSMARWIGPECAGTSSAVIPFTFMLDELREGSSVP